jgi:predicted HAD superfamily phosphohydrolase
MNTQNIPNAPANDVENERTVRDKIVEYLYRVEIVSDSMTLLLLQQAVDALQKRVDQSLFNVIAKDSTLNNILQQMQTLIVKLEAKSSYSKIIRKTIDLVQISTSTMRITKKTVSSLDRNQQTREFIVIIIDVVEKKNLEIMFTKDIMSKLQNDVKNI